MKVDINIKKKKNKITKIKKKKKKRQMTLNLSFADKEGFVRERFFDLIYVKETFSMTLKKEIYVVLAVTISTCKIFGSKRMSILIICIVYVPLTTIVFVRLFRDSLSLNLLQELKILLGQCGHVS